MGAIEGHVRRLDRALTGPRRLKADMLREVRHGLVDAAEAYEADGVADPERRAIDEFGAVPEVAPAYQAELASSATRSVALRVTAAYGVGAFAANLMWTGAPWVGEPPPAAFQVLAQVINVVGNGLAVCGAVTLAALWLRTRAGRPVPVAAMRLVNRGLAVLLVVAWAVGVAMFTWSAVLWQAALSWPPMIAGTAVMSVATVWIAHAVRPGLTATRTTAGAGLTTAGATRTAAGATRTAAGGRQAGQPG
jgi:hypothetical protein